LVDAVEQAMEDALVIGNGCIYIPRKWDTDTAPWFHLTNDHLDLVAWWKLFAGH
jgi:hypothetical protein